MRMGIREMLVNAIEHGNLSLDFEEKTQAMLDGVYFESVDQRRKDPKYKYRKVYVEYKLTKEHFYIQVKDEGEGFDMEAIEKLTREEYLNEQGLSHGRGIRMARSIFDEVIYNEKGNEVTLIKRVSKSKVDISGRREVETSLGEFSRKK